VILVFQNIATGLFALLAVSEKIASQLEETTPINEAISLQAYGFTYEQFNIIYTLIISLLFLRAHWLWSWVAMVILLITAIVTVNRIMVFPILINSFEQHDYFKPVVALILIGSYFIEKNCLEGFLAKEMLKEERKGFMEVMDLLSERVVIYKTNLYECPINEDKVNFEVSFIN